MSDLDEVVYDLVHTAQTWTGPMPVGMPEQSTRQRVESAAYSVLVMLDGDSGPGAMALRRKGGGEVQTGGLHEVRSDQHDDPEARRLLDEVERRARHITCAYGSAERAVPEFIGLFLRLIAADYELRLLRTDWESGESIGEGEDIASLLPDAFARAWAASAV